MMGPHHAACGAAAWCAAVTPAPWGLGLIHLPVHTALTAIAVSAGAALLADADHHSATLARALPPVSGWVCRGVGALSGGHRHGTHSLLGTALLGLLTWLGMQWTRTSGTNEVMAVGAMVITAVLVSFGLDALRIFHSALTRWLATAIMTSLIAVTSLDELRWLPLAVITGQLAHLTGDMLTTQGVPWLWPVAPRPPRWWRSSPFLRRFWRRNGNVAVPILGSTGSRREWVMATLVLLYTAGTASSLVATVLRV